MRNIKFKAFIKELGKIYDVVMLDFEDKKVQCELGFLQFKFFNFDDIELMQSTGLLDKNGKEIYDGYIVSSIIDKKRPIEEAVIRDDMMGNPTIKNIKVGEQHIIGKAIYEIRWIDWGCKFEGVFIKYEPAGTEIILGSGNLFLHPDSDNYKLEVEVIGNIHENPELLSN